MNEPQTSSFGMAIPADEAWRWDLVKLHEHHLEERKAYPQKWFDEDWTLQFGSYVNNPIETVDHWEDEDYDYQIWHQEFSCSIHNYLSEQFTLRDYEGRVSVWRIGPDDTLKDWPISEVTGEKVLRVDLKRKPRYETSHIFPPFSMEGLSIKFAGEEE